MLTAEFLWKNCTGGKKTASSASTLYFLNHKPTKITIAKLFKGRRDYEKAKKEKIARPLVFFYG
jgi:hypothetical protein